MSVLHRVRACVLVCVAVVAALGAFVLAPAASAGTIGSTYLALGDSLAYGFHEAQFFEEFEKGTFTPLHFDEGYVDDFAAVLKSSNPSLQYINDGCPGETTEAFIHGSGIGGFCSNFPAETPFPNAYLHHRYEGTQLEDALTILKENPNVSPITLDIGSNDVLQFLQNSCGFPKENKCANEQIEGEFAHIAANVDSILTQLHAAAPHAQIVFVAAYNPYPGVPTPGGDLLEAGLNAALANVAASIPHTTFANTEPVFNPSIITGGPESEDIPTICAYTAMCPGGVFNPASPKADIHPTKLGYEVMAAVLEKEFFNHIFPEFTNWAVSGSVGLKKLDQSITIPAGSTFNGEAALNLASESGPLTGTFAVPPFEATLKILGIPAKVGLEVTQVGAIAGSIEKSKSVEGDVTLSAPTKANIGFNTIDILGLKIPTKCQTAEPLQLNLVDNLTLSELLTTGSHFTGTTTFPTVKCEGALGSLEGAVLSTLFSGPNNPYSVNISPPA
jgi:lysophospholipase L1-like esterase